MNSETYPLRPAIAPVGGRSVIRGWLLLLAAMVYAMILIGGATRLTDSGLSITEWAPLHGALPPLNATDWQAEFAKYRETAEYRFQNAGMSLSEFQYIYWWEWGHRQFGRMIGLVAIGGLAAFAILRWARAPLMFRLLGLVALGGLQGLIGWWMVASGIGSETARLDVAPYRLATHFSLALLIIGCVAWLWMELGPHLRARTCRALRWAAIALLGLVTLQMAGGALVAGLDAGRSYTDWPLMAGELFPQNYIDPGLGLRSLFEGREATQFNHRTLAYLLLAGAWASVYAARRTHLAGSFLLLAAMVSLQAVWGILTLVRAAPLELALIHQGLGVVVFLVSVRLVWRASYSPPAERSVSAAASTKAT